MLCLKAPTDAGWPRLALADLGQVLADHAHCEMKAAANALSLASRPPASLEVARGLAELAREELDHFQKVLALLEARRIPLGPPPVDAYAAQLRKASAALGAVQDLGPLVERLLLGALIEARSCERFRLLLDARDPALPDDVRALYTELFPAEARHYRLFVEWALAEAPGREAAVRSRLDRLAAAEAQVVAQLMAQDDRATIHG